MDAEFFNVYLEKLQNQVKDFAIQNLILSTKLEVAEKALAVMVERAEVQAKFDAKNSAKKLSEVTKKPKEE